MEFTLKQFIPWAKSDQNDFKAREKQNLESIAAPSFDDGAREVEVQQDSANYSGVVQNMFGSQDVEIKNTAQLINTYRGLMNNFEVDNAVQQIVDDAIVYEDDNPVVSLDLDGTKFSQRIKDLLFEELDVILSSLKFHRKGADHFRRWYIDSRIFFHKIVDPKKPKNGIIELRRLDPRNLEFIREVITAEEGGTKIIKGYKEYFLYSVTNESYNWAGRQFAIGTKIRIPREAITYAHSGLISDCGRNIIGYLHRAVKPANQLKLLEDALVIYRITRAPERRVFYIDTGNMPNRKASQHMQNIMNSLKNRVVYDSSTGKVKNQQHNMSMTEDYYLQRRDGKSVTEVTSLPGADSLGVIEDVRWFKRNLYEALRVPLTRIPNMDQSPQFSNGTEITRDEISFAKFIKALQHKFEEIILDPLRTNCYLKGILSKEEFDDEINNIKIVFNRDSYFEEMKDAEIMERRINMLSMADPYIGKYISHQTAMKKFLQMTDEEIEQEAKLIEEESKENRFQDKEEEEF
ncbi:portal protein [Serratia phage Muldoon]|uniref:Portal protein n=1 Tax=Serratia phage Muldoon TaxID=2601678 RepID=A0A5P8PHI3_9CAUD|nr:portal protein [Serratia phage Muldoon]QFR56124.1 portal protein [Serratia phage Muldoon]